MTFKTTEDTIKNNKAQHPRKQRLFKLVGDISQNVRVLWKNVGVFLKKLSRNTSIDGLFFEKPRDITASMWTLPCYIHLMVSPSTWCSRQFVLLGSDFYHHDGSFLYKNSSIRPLNKHRKRQKVVSATLKKQTISTPLTRNTPHRIRQFKKTGWKKYYISLTYNILPYYLWRLWKQKVQIPCRARACTCVRRCNLRLEEQTSYDEHKKIEPSNFKHNFSKQQEKKSQRGEECTDFNTMTQKSENNLVYLQADKCILVKTLDTKVRKITSTGK